MLAGNEEIDLHRVVYNSLTCKGWSYDSLAYLLEISGSILPHQDLRATLPLAILGSWQESFAGITSTLVLLIRKGADVHDNDDETSKKACNPTTRYGRDGIQGGVVNSDRRLLWIWIAALLTCGHDADFIADLPHIEYQKDVAEKGTSDEEMDKNVVHQSAMNMLMTRFHPSMKWPSQS